MDPGQLQKHILGTYQYLRILIAVIGFLLPFALYFGGRIGSGVCLQDSLSSYYHATPSGAVRDWLVGSLVAVGALLVAYKGYTRTEDRLLNVAGAMCAGIALFPMTWNSWSFRLCDGTHPPHPDPLPITALNPHGLFAVTFFLCIALVCWFCAGNTLSLLDGIPGVAARKTQLQRCYRAIAVTMVVSIAVTYFYHTWREDSRVTFAVEFAGIMSFVAYWAIKSWEMAKTEADLKTARAQVGIRSGKATMTAGAAAGAGAKQ
jgi:hypothetical protein